ncbi:triple tyrosine motif-containing protein [Brunnivagina elsteri]|uniref:Uncharacterized protein n=1 Tax=Brunnivagina elsteri CCALA 953 TaxID=987040 RepID=A0A2A2TDN5_9CYAN|nr:triple tyrosine motif-containing protein [Calothrix elsteri]PAX51852.1 hypothetical protein CK510_22530 [Calothrix elsteri CCALA 953]
MQNQYTSVLKVIINPPDILQGMPGDTLQLHVIITNQGYKDARIDVSFDEAFQNLNLSNNPLQECLSLASQKSYEVSFEFQIPPNTPPGTYDYRLIVDAPEDYPQETPISFPLQIQVLIKEQTVRRGGDDPTFIIKPASNPKNQLIYKPGQPLLLTVAVNNRCQQVDRFRLTCPDLDDTWFTIRYPRTGYEGAGVLSEENGLELNDYSQGEILLEIHPPADAFAGTYPPTIQLYSQNRQDLILLDLVYLQIPENYILDIELNTILGKSSRAAGKYQLKLTNRGNTDRELVLDAKTQDEEELCNYKFEPLKVRLLPQKSTDVNLTVDPTSSWRQPWLGSGLFINFQIEIQDQKQLPLPDKLPQGTFIWKARPWWHFFLLLLLILGILGGSAFIIWRILHPEPAKIDFLKPTNPTYQEGNKISLNWQVSNVKQLDNLRLSFTAENLEPKEYSYKINELNDGKNCQTQNNTLTCNNFITEAKQPGKYTFKLEAYKNKNNKVDEKTTSPVEIKLLPSPEIVNDSFSSDKLQYETGQQVNLSWRISNPEQLASLQIINKQENGTLITIGNFDFTKGIPPQLQKQCQKGNELTCQNVPMGVSTPGKYTIFLQPTSKSPFQYPKNLKASNPININVTSKPFEIEFFGINNNQQSTQSLDEGATVTLRWKVKADPKDVIITLSHSGKKVNVTGSESIIVIPEVGISVEDKYGQQKPISMKITIIPKPKNSPTPATGASHFLFSGQRLIH